MAGKQRSEEWRPVKGWEGLYEVSDQGRVRSLRRRTPRLMRGELNDSGYPVVHLREGARRRARFRVHRLVLHAFAARYTPPPVGEEKD